MGVPSSRLRRITSSTRHSSAQGLAATRGGLTSTEGAASRPAWPNSLAPRGSGAEVAFMASRNAKVGMFHTNSRVSSAKVMLSFRPSLEKARIATGSDATALKKE